MYISCSLAKRFRPPIFLAKLDVTHLLQKSNNHDLLGLRMYNDAIDAWEVDSFEEDEDEMDSLMHHMEHELFSKWYIANFLEMQTWKCKLKLFFRFAKRPFFISNFGPRWGRLLRGNHTQEIRRDKPELQ